MPLILLGTCVALVMLFAQTVHGAEPVRMERGSEVRIVFSIQIALTLAFAKYAVYVMREELRACAVGCCLSCWYDLRGNESGVCPECGTPRSAAHV